MSVDLAQPKQETLALGKDILFPTQHIARIIETAKSGASVLEARVFDGSDTGEKIFDTLTVVGKEETTPGPDAEKAEPLKSVRRWPVTISYFDAAKKDAGARICPFVRPLRERRFRQSEARLRRPFRWRPN